MKTGRRMIENNFKDKWSSIIKRKSISEIAIIISSINIAFTAFTNLEALFSFAKFIQWLSQSWRLLIQDFVNFILSFFKISVSIDISVFWFLYISFILLCAISYSNKRIAKSNLYDSVSLGMSLTFFIIIAFANKAIFLIIFSKSGQLSPIFQDSPATFIFFIGSLLSIAAVYKGRQKKMGFYVYRSSVIGISLALFTLPIAIDLIMFVFVDESLIFNWLSSVSVKLSNSGWGTLAVIFSLLYVALLPSLFASPLFITNHAILSRRFILTNVLVFICFIVNFIFLAVENSALSP